MKKVVIVLAAFALIAFGALIALIIAMHIGQNQGTDDVQQAQAESLSSADDELSAELAAEIAELEAMLQEILAGDSPAQYTDVPIISSQEARDIAALFIGHGEVFGDLLFMDDGVFVFEVDIRHEETRYMVYVNAIDGSVIRMDQYDDNIFP